MYNKNIFTVPSSLMVTSKELLEACEMDHNIYFVWNNFIYINSYKYIENT